MVRSIEGAFPLDLSAHSLRDVLEALGETSRPEVVETPLSWVILSERHAFKMRKAVDVGEAQFSTPTRRRQACIDEVWRNERLAPGVYVGVVTLTTGRDGVLRVGGKGPEAEWLIKMRRLDPQRNLKTLIRTRQVCRTQVDDLARSLTAFYQAGAPQTDHLEDLCGRLLARINDSAGVLVESLPPSAAALVRQLREVQRNFLESARPTLNLRVCDGRIVDGHGDLRPSRVFLERQPVVVGCVAYSPRTRILDALDDLGSLAMECEFLDRTDIADEIMSVYRQLAHDEGFAHLEAFYKSLRACRRAAGACQERRLATDESDRRRCLSEALRYLDCARRYAANFA